MKRINHLFFLVIVATLIFSCGPIPDEPNNKYKDWELMGRWQAPSQAAEAHADDSIVFVFMADSCVRSGSAYGRWGYTFDEGEDVHESDLLSQEEDGDYHGNGWFGWQLDGSDIQTYQMFTISPDRVAPYRYTIIKLTSDSLILQEGKRTHHLSKQL